MCTLPIDVSFKSAFIRTVCHYYGLGKYGEREGITFSCDCSYTSLVYHSVRQCQQILIVSASLIRFCVLRLYITGGGLSFPSPR